MKKLTIVILSLVIVVVGAGLNLVFATDNNPSGITYTYKGGQWENPTSWNPETGAGGPAEDDNVVIPKGTVATMPNFCSVATVSLEGNLETDGELRVNSMTIFGDGKLTVKGKIQSTGKFTNNGQMNVYPAGKLYVQKFENTGYVSTRENLIITSMDGFTNTGFITSQGDIFLRCHELDNSGKITSVKSDVSIFSNTEIINNGRIKAGDSEGTAGGGSVYVACSTFTGGGEVTAGNGKNGNPPRSAGKTYIGKTFDNAEWTAATSAKPTGVVSDLSIWNIQIAKNPAVDGVEYIAKESLLVIEKPSNGRPMPGRNGYSIICKTGGTTINTTLHWKGAEDIRATGSTSLGRLGSSYENISAGGKKTIKIVIPPAKSSERELKKVNIKYTVPGTTYTARLTLHVYYLPCPVITGVAGMNCCTIEEDDGTIRDTEFPVTPIISGDRLMVPLRFVVESCGGVVSWDEGERTARIDLPGRTATFTPNMDNSNVNGVTEGLYKSSFINNKSDRMMVSGRSLCEIMGADISFDDGVFEITYPGS